MLLFFYYFILTMPNLANAKKALRHSQRRQISNLNYKKDIKDLSKKFSKLIIGNQLAEAKKIASLLQQKLDKAVKAGGLKANSASRKKSKLARAIRVK
jgi:small subunit ribosomal protein S20